MCLFLYNRFVCVEKGKSTELHWYFWAFCNYCACIEIIPIKNSFNKMEHNINLSICSYRTPPSCRHDTIVWREKLTKWLKSHKLSKSCCLESGQKKNYCCNRRHLGKKHEDWQKIWEKAILSFSSGQQISGRLSKFIINLEVILTGTWSFTVLNGISHTVMKQSMKSKQKLSICFSEIFRAKIVMIYLLWNKILLNLLYLLFRCTSWLLMSEQGEQARIWLTRNPRKSN